MRSPVARLSVVLLFIAVACAPAAPSPAPSGPGAPAEPKRAAQQVLRIGTNIFPNGLTPFATAFGFWSLGNQFDALLNFDAKYDLVPGIAERWELAPTGDAWRFYLRKDLTFSTGEKLTADDVVHVIETGRAERMPVAQQDAQLRGARLVDEYTVDILMAERNVATLYVTPSWQIWSKKHYESVGKNGFLAQPVGSGPYVLAEYVPSQTIVYKLRTDRPHPYRKPIVTEIRITNVPEPSALINGMRTGEIDMALGSFSPDQARQAKDSGITVVQPPRQAGYYSILFNKDPIKGTPYEDKRVRLALNYAVDKDAIAKTLYAGFAQPIGQLSVPGDPSYNPDLKPVPFDPATAKRLLAEAGYPNGFRAGAIDFVARPQNTSVLQAVQSMHRDVGVQWELNPVESGVYVDIAYGLNGRDAQRKEMIEAGGSNTNGIWTFPWAFLKCAQAKPLYCVPELDRNMQLALAELDKEKRNAHLRTAMKAWVEEWPMVFLISTPQFTLLGTNLRGFVWTTQSFYYLDGIYKVE
jgi:peptide/nickel transport system substrate-binding protein